MEPDQPGRITPSGPPGRRFVFPVHLGSMAGWLGVGGSRRRLWSVDGRTHIEVRGLSGPLGARLSEDLERAVGALDGVRWAEVNAATGRLVVAFDPDASPIENVVGVVEALEDRHGVQGALSPPWHVAHPADPEALRRAWIAAGADGIGLVAGVLGRALTAGPVPGELATLVSLVDNEPRLRRQVERVLTPPIAELVLAGANATAQTLSGGPLGLVVDLANRVGSVGELSARASSWRRREGHLAGVPGRGVSEPVEHAPRPVPLRSGPIERHADRAALLSVGAFGGALALGAGPRRSAALVTAGLAKAARLGREAFASELGRALSGRDMVVMDPDSLRRLDRIDVALLDGRVLVTGRLQLAEVVTLPGGELRSLRAAVGRLVDVQAPERLRRRREWVVGPLGELEALRPRGAQSVIEAFSEAHPSVVGVARAGVLVGLAGLDHELDPFAEPLVAAARRSGLRVLVAGTRLKLAGRLRADGALAGHGRLRDGVRGLQQAGEGVLVVAGAGAHGPLLAADVGIGVVRSGRAVPWGADILTNEDSLADACVVVGSVGPARSASSTASVVAIGGSVVGATSALVGTASGANRRAALAVNGAALGSQALGALRGRTAGRAARPLPIEQAQWWALGSREVLGALGSSPSGLAEAEAARRERPTLVLPTPWRLARGVARELANPLTPILAVGSALAAVTGSVADAGLIAAVGGAGAVLGALERVRSERELATLARQAQAEVTVVRSGSARRVPSDRLARGDVVELRAGDVVPADCRILEADGTEVDESALTGEAFPVDKAEEATPGAPVDERSCMLFEGTTVVAGSAKAVVVATGEATTVGRTLLGAGSTGPSGVEARLAELSRLVLPVTLASGVAVAGISLVRGIAPQRALGAAVSLAVASVPEGLPLVAEAAELAAARRLAERGAVVRETRSIEALGRTDVLCFDKTGTLTTGEIGLDSVSDGVRSEPLERLGERSRHVLLRALWASPAANGEPLAHPTDRAVVRGATEAGLVTPSTAGRFELVSELAFDERRGFHAVVGRVGDRAEVCVKGAPEVVVARSIAWLAPDGRRVLTAALRRRLLKEAERMAASGLRVLAVASRETSGAGSLGDERVRDLELLGFLGLADTVRPSAAKAVANLLEGGVRVVMLTGDHPVTATSIAEPLGLLRGRRLVTGAELDQLSNDELDSCLGEIGVFARVNPGHKVRLVEAYQRTGRVVAMTGDGGNDAAAIRMADVGVAIGRRAAPAARRAADIVVLDGRLETVVDAIVEGRAMWASVREALAILVGGNLGEAAFTVTGTAIGGRSPLGARQLLVVNLLTDLAPALAVAVRRPSGKSPEVLLAEGPDRSLGSRLLAEVAIRGAATAAGATAAWSIARATGRHRRASTVALASLVGTQLGQTVVAGRASPLVLAATVASAGLLVGAIQTPVVSQFLGCTPLGPVGWTIAATSAAGATLASAAASWVAFGRAGGNERESGASSTG